MRFIRPKWPSEKKQLLDAVEAVFEDKRGRKQKKTDDLESGQHSEQIGRLKVENDWLKKKLQATTEERRRLIDQPALELPVSRQCEILGLSRSTCYYHTQEVSERDLCIMRQLDELFMKYPFYECRGMAVTLGIDNGYTNRLVRKKHKKFKDIRYNDKKVRYNKRVRGSGSSTAHGATRQGIPEPNEVRTNGICVLERVLEQKRRTPENGPPISSIL